MAAESKLDRKLREYAEDCGVLYLKFTSPGRRGVPDRLLLAPRGRMGLMELKAQGKRPGPVQARAIHQLHSLGYKVRVVDSFDQGKAFIDELSGGEP